MCSVPGLWPGVQLPDTSTLSQALTPSHIPPPPPQHRQRIIQKQRQRSSLLFGGQNWFSSLPNRFSARMIWRNGWIEKWTLRGMDVSEQLDYTPFSLHHTKPHPPKMDVHTNFFLQIILAAKWLTRDSSTSLKLQRRPLPSLLYKSFFYAATESPVFILSAYLLA